jgi:hypothetical protein
VTPLYATEKQREKVGEALGNPIYRDQIDEKKELYGQLHKLFRMPFQKKYLEAHKNELEICYPEHLGVRSCFLQFNPLL